MAEARPFISLQLAVFAVVSASFTNIYITQPVLPVLRQEFGADMVTVSFSVSAVILGIALSNLPFGYLADRWEVRPILLTGGLMVALFGGICAWTGNLYVLIGARFVQGLFIPALTTCLAAYLSRTLPVERLGVVMGSYVSATVAGGLGGRLLGGFIHPPLNWRYAFLTAAALILSATATALAVLPRVSRARPGETNPSGVLKMLYRWDLLRIFCCAAGAFGIFSSIFNYLPFRLTESPFYLPTERITLLYLVYVVGIFIGPATGRLTNRFGPGLTLIHGGLVMGICLAALLIPNIYAILLGLLGVCTGFFTVHAAAIGMLNRRLSGGQGRANALYVLFYYMGGWGGITASGLFYARSGWPAVVLFCGVMSLAPLAVGLVERTEKHE